MKDILNRVSESIGSTITESIVETAESLREQLGNHLSKMNDLADSAKEKIAEQVSHILEVTPAVEKLGFSVEGVSVNMGLPPSAVFKFKKLHDVDMVVYEELIKDNENRPLVKNLLRTLISADQCQKKIKMGSFRFSSIEIQVGLTPSVSFQLSPSGNC